MPGVTVVSLGQTEATVNRLRGPITVADLNRRSREHQSPRGRKLENTMFAPAPASGTLCTASRSEKSRLSVRASKGE
jgi:hypothetical protein